MKYLNMLKSFAFAAALTLAASVEAAWVLPGVDISSSAATFRGDQPYVVVDPAGNAVAVWRESTDGTSFFIQAATRPFNGAWTTPVTISTSTTGTGFRGIIFSGSQQGNVVAVDAAGNAVAVWITGILATPSSLQIQYATLPFGGVWSGPVTISAAPFGAFGPAVAMDPSGNAVAVWSATQDVGNTTVFLEAAIKPAGGVFTPTSNLPSSGLLGRSLYADLAMDKTGNAYVLWIEDVLARHFFSYLAAGTVTWTPPETLVMASGSGTVAGGLGPAISVDISGNAVGSWLELNSGVVSAVAAFRPIDGPWDATILVSPFGQTVNSTIGVPNTIDPFGNATVIFTNNTLASAIQATTRPFATGVWSTPETISNVAAPGEILADVQAGANGDLFAIFSSSVAGLDEIQGNNKPFGGSWQAAPTVLSTAGVDSNNRNYWPRIAVDALGNATAIWVRDNTAPDTVIQSTAFLSGNVASSFAGKRITNKFATQTEYIDRLTWGAILGAYTYTVSIDGTVLTTVPSTTLTYDVRQRAKLGSYTYTLTAYNVFGVVVDTRTVTVAPAPLPTTDSNSFSSSDSSS